jgi:hypothetical protein
MEWNKHKISPVDLQKISQICLTNVHKKSQLCHLRSFFSSRSGNIWFRGLVKWSRSVSGLRMFGSNWSRIEPLLKEYSSHMLNRRAQKNLLDLSAHVCSRGCCSHAKVSLFYRDPAVATSAWPHRLLLAPAGSSPPHLSCRLCSPRHLHSPPPTITSFVILVPRLVLWHGVREVAAVSTWGASTTQCVAPRSDTYNMFETTSSRSPRASGWGATTRLPSSSSVMSFCGEATLEKRSNLALSLVFTCPDLPTKIMFFAKPYFYCRYWFRVQVD